MKILNKLLIIGIIGLLLVGSFMFISNYDKPIDKKENYGKYHGPVPLGYNQTHFWKTGEMILEVKK